MFDKYYTWLTTNGYLGNLATGRKMLEDMYFNTIKDDVSDNRDSFFANWDLFLIGKLQSSNQLKIQYISDKQYVEYAGEIYDTRAKFNKLADVLYSQYAIEKMKTLKYLQEAQNPISVANESPNKIFVETALRVLNVEFNENGILVGKIFSNELSPVKYDELLTKILVMVDREISINGTPLKRDFIKNQLDDMLSQMYENKKNAIKDILRFSEANDERLTSAAKAILRYGKIAQTDANVEMIKHAMWSLKRRLYSKGIAFGVFFSFFSRKMGVGKSYFLQHILCSPFINLVNTDAKLEQLLSDNDRKALINGYIACDFQELIIPDKYVKPDGSVAEQVINTLKSTITGDYFSGRQLYTDKNMKMFNSAVYFTTTNKHIYDIVKDENGMRRYWEFDWGIESAKDIDIDLGNKIANHMIEVYQLINENDECGYYHPSNKHYDEMCKKQEKYRHIPVIEQFANECGITFFRDFEEGCEIQSKNTFYETIFKDWIESEGRSWTMHGMSKAIRDRFDVNPVPHTLGTVTKPCYFFKQIGSLKSTRSNLPVSFKLASNQPSSNDIYSSFKEMGEL